MPGWGVPEGAPRGEYSHPCSISPSLGKLTARRTTPAPTGSAAPWCRDPPYPDTALRATPLAALTKVRLVSRMYPPPGVSLLCPRGCPGRGAPPHSSWTGVARDPDSQPPFNERGRSSCGPRGRPGNSVHDIDGSHNPGSRVGDGEREPTVRSISRSLGPCSPSSVPCPA